MANTAPAGLRDGNAKVIAVAEWVGDNLSKFGNMGTGFFAWYTGASATQFGFLRVMCAFLGANLRAVPVFACFT